MVRGISAPTISAMVKPATDFEKSVLKSDMESGFFSVAISVKSPLAQSFTFVANCPQAASISCPLLLRTVTRTRS
jgi:hypothetical protein